VARACAEEITAVSCVQIRAATECPLNRSRSFRAGIDLGLIHLPAAFEIRSFIVTILNDIAVALESYLQDEVVVSIVDVAPAAGTTPAVNINEKFKFKVKVENTGHINMTNVSLRVAGSNGTEISTSLSGSYFGGLTTGAYTINGGSSVTSSYFYFEAPSTTKPVNTLLVVAHVADWTGNWDHMFANHTLDGSLVEPTGRYSAQVQG
jgi:hypothetical protein